MPMLPGLGTFAESFLNTYKTMHGMDIENKALEYKRALAQEEARKRILEERRIEAELAAKAAERAAGLELTEGLKGVPPHQLGEALPGIIARSKDPYALMGAAKRYQEGVGGILSPEYRDKLRLRNEMSGILEAHAAGDLPAEAVGRAAVRRGIAITDLVGLVSELTTKDDILKAFYIEQNKLPAQAGGILGAPGRPSLPGRPAPVVAPGEPTAGDVTAKQAGKVAGLEAGGREIGKAEAWEIPSPVFGKNYGQLIVDQVARESEARQTELDQRLKNLDTQLKSAELSLKQAALIAEPGKRAEIASRTAQQLMTSQWIVDSIRDPAVKERFKLLLDQARDLAVSSSGGKGAAPVGAPTGAPKILNITPIPPGPSVLPSRSGQAPPGAGPEAPNATALKTQWSRPEMRVRIQEIMRRDYPGVPAARILQDKDAIDDIIAKLNTMGR